MIQFKLIALLLVFSFVHISGSAQDSNPIPCPSETSQFDFWLGGWKVEWKNSDGSSGEGINVVKSILNGCVVEENFDANESLDFTGKSFSVYNSKKNLWQQTWVDNQGTYMVFTGGMDDDKMILSRKITTDEKEIIQRMVFYDIKEDRFTWNWERSDDGGQTWQLTWQIHYTRM